MQLCTFLGLTAFLAVGQGLPVSESPSSPGIVPVTFHGAAGAHYTKMMPTDGTTVMMDDPLSISSIESSGMDVSQCHLNTVDYTPALVAVSPGYWQMGPPQTIHSMSCNVSKRVRRDAPVMDMVFEGAADGRYNMRVPLDGTVVHTNNPLSVSTIKSAHPNMASCRINAVDYEPAMAKISGDTWAAGPPQTIHTIQCWQ